MTPLEQKVLQDAVACIGVAETGPNSGPSVDIYLAAQGLRPGNPWCVCFVLFRILKALKELGLKLTIPLPRTGSSSALFRWAKRNGLLIDKPHPGCIAILKGGSTGYDHSCIVESVCDGAIHSIDGNWGNRVCRTHHPIADCVFVRLPDTVKETS